MDSENECIFCHIVAKTLPAHVVYEDDTVLAFMDISPASPGHTLLVTKHHYDNVLEALPEDIAHVGRVSVALAKAVRDAVGAEGIGLHQLNGAAAGQTVFHYHQHFIPQNTGETLEIHSRVSGDSEQIAKLAARIRGLLNTTKEP
ncbi:MAG: HIT domain-containing protein [Pseudomonadales bacterium]